MRVEVAGTKRRQHRRPSHQRTEVEVAVAVAAGRGRQEVALTCDKLSGKYGSWVAAVRYDSMRRLSRRLVCFRWFGLAGCISRSGWVYHTTVQD